ncbi:hypothetical protein YC2023_004833 [Brassica napus]
MYDEKKGVASEDQRIKTNIRLDKEEGFSQDTPLNTLHESQSLTSGTGKLNSNELSSVKTIRSWVEWSLGLSFRIGSLEAESSLCKWFKGTLHLKTFEYNLFVRVELIIRVLFPVAELAWYHVGHMTHQTNKGTEPKQVDKELKIGEIDFRAKLQIR